MHICSLKSVAALGAELKIFFGAVSAATAPLHDMSLIQNPCEILPPYFYMFASRYPLSYLRIQFIYGITAGRLYIVSPVPLKAGYEEQG